MAKRQDIPQGVIRMYKQQIQSGTMSDAELKNFLAEGILDKKELMDEGILTHQKIKDLFQNEYLEKIGNGLLSENEIQSIIQEGIFTNEEIKEIQKRAFNYKISNGLMNDDEIQRLVQKGSLDLQELLKGNILSSERIREIYIKGILQHQYSNQEIKDMVDNGWFTGEYLLGRGVITKDKHDMLFIQGGVKIDYNEWANVPPLEEGRIDVFVFGIAGSGKSCFLAGLFYYGHTIGNLNPQIRNRSGYMYADTLTDAVEQGRVPTATGVDYIQYIACDIEDSEQQEHPLTFIEMSGEHFQDAYGQTIGYLQEKKPRLVEYLFNNPNRKVIFLAVDYQPSTSQRKHFDFMLRFLDENGALENVEAIILVITKLDGNGEHLQAQAKDFLEKNYQGLLKLCDKLVEKYNLDFYIYKFSLGQFRSNFVYDYDNTDSKLIFDMLSDITSFRKKTTKKSGGWWSKIFKG